MTDDSGESLTQLPEVDEARLRARYRALVTPFVEHQPGPGPDGKVMDRSFLVAHYDFVLAPPPEPRREPCVR